MRLSDMIAALIEQMLAEADGIAEIQRNELASKVGCVPSQINYVITSRFTPEQGYLVESRRGGGGFIRITRAHRTGHEMLVQAIDAAGDTLSEETARRLIRTLCGAGALDEEAGMLLRAASCDQNYRPLSREEREAVRAAVFKQMILSLVR